MNIHLMMLLGFIARCYGEEGSLPGPTGGGGGTGAPMNSGSGSPIDDDDVDIPSNYAVDVLYFPNGGFLPFPNPIDDCVITDSQAASTTYSIFECDEGSHVNATDYVTKTDYTDSDCSTQDGNVTTWVLSSDRDSGDVGSFGCNILENDYYFDIAVYDGTACSGDPLFTKRIVPGVCAHDSAVSDTFSIMWSCAAEMEGVVFKTYLNTACNGDVNEAIEVELDECSGDVFTSDSTGDDYSIIVQSNEFACYFVAEEDDDDDSALQTSLGLFSMITMMVSAAWMLF